MLSDIEIANSATLRPIREVAAETLGIAERYLVPYGHFKAKVDLGYLASLADRPLGRLVLVTALSPPHPGRARRPRRWVSPTRCTGWAAAPSRACASRPWARSSA